MQPNRKPNDPAPALVLRAPDSPLTRSGGVALRIPERIETSARVDMDGRAVVAFTGRKAQLIAAGLAVATQFPKESDDGGRWTICRAVLGDVEHQQPTTTEERHD